MNFIRNHWFDIGGLAAIVITLLVISDINSLSRLQFILWLNLAALLFHQVEEYRFPGTFPGTINSKIFHSQQPNRFPLNANTALIINVYLGWSLYILAALTGTRFIWLSMASMMVSLGNLLAHTFFFNIKGRTFYNAGFITSWVCFAPCIFYFFRTIYTEQLADAMDYLTGISLGIIINILGVVKPITWLASKDSPYPFRSKQLINS